MKLSGIWFKLSLKYKGIISSCNNNVSLNPLIKDFPEHIQIYKNWLDTLVEYGTLMSIETDGSEDTPGPGLHLEKGVSERGLL